MHTVYMVTVFSIPVFTAVLLGELFYFIKNLLFSEPEFQHFITKKYANISMFMRYMVAISNFTLEMMIVVFSYPNTMEPRFISCRAFTCYNLEYPRSFRRGNQFNVQKSILKVVMLFIALSILTYFSVDNR
eukprot:UN04562